MTISFFINCYLDLIEDENEIVFVWVPSHIDVKGSLAADSAAENAFDGDV